MKWNHRFYNLKKKGEQNIKSLKNHCSVGTTTSSPTVQLPHIWCCWQLNTRLPHDSQLQCWFFHCRYRAEKVPVQVLLHYSESASWGHQTAGRVSPPPPLHAVHIRTYYATNRRENNTPNGYRGKPWRPCFKGIIWLGSNAHTDQILLPFVPPLHTLHYIYPSPERV